MHGKKEHEERHHEEKEHATGKLDKTDDKTVRPTFPPLTIIPVSPTEKTEETATPSNDIKDFSVNRGPSLASEGTDGKIMPSMLQSSGETKDVTKIDI